MIPPYKLPQNSMHGSPASSNYQQTTISHSPSSRFVPPQSSSTNRFIGQQNSPVPSPYAPQSPAGYMPYSHPGGYPQHQGLQQASVSSPIVAGGLRNLHENKVSGQLSGSSANHHADNSRHGTTEDYLQMVHRLGGEDSDSSIRNAASFSLRSPQSVCSPAGSEGTPKGSRPLILQTQPPPYSSPRDAPPDILLDSPDRKQRRPKKLKLSKDDKEQTEKSAMYDIISSPSKDSTKLTLRLTRVRSSEMDQQGDMLSNMENSNLSEGDAAFNAQFPGNASKTPVTPQDLSRPLNAAACFQEQSEFLQVQQVPVLQPNTSAAAKPPQPLVAQSQPQQTGNITPYDEVELDALAEIERIERESAIERERFSKEVQDKDKPLKKRKQDSYPLEAGGATGGNRPASQETGSAGNGSRPALMVSIDLQHAGRGDSQATVTQDSDCARKADNIKNCNDGYISGPQEDTVFKHNPENHPLRKSESDMECPDKSIKSTTANLSTERGLEESLNETKLCDIKSEPVECSEEAKVSSDCPTEAKSESCEVDYDDSMMDFKNSEGSNEDIKTEALLNETSNDVKSFDLQDESKENGNQSKSSKIDNRLEIRQKQKQNDGQPETPRQKFEGKSEALQQKVEVKSEASKQKAEGKPETIRQKSEVKSDTLKQKTEGHPETPKQKNENKPETPKQRSDSKPETQKQKNDSKPDTPKQKSEGRPETPKQKSESRPNTPKQKSEGRQDTSRQKNEGRQEINRQKSEEHKSDGRPETPKHKHDMKKDSNRLSTEKKPDLSKHKTDSKSDSPRVKPEGRTDGVKQRIDGRPSHESSKRDCDNPKQKHDDKGESEKHKGEMSRLRRPESLRSFSKNDQETRPGSKPDTPKMDKAEKKHRRDSDDSREKHSSGEQKQRPGSPRIKQDSKSDPNKSDSSKLKSDKPALKSPTGKEEKRTDGNKSKVEGNKGHSDNKTGFPSYLLGGNQGTLKNFVIPKLKRDKDGNITQESKRSESKGEQMDKPEKMGFVEDLNKGAKPVVVLQKLSLDEVQKLIKERDDKSKGSLKSNKNRPSKSSKGKKLVFFLKYDFSAGLIAG
ncbi:hypothetical protein XELAEV_18011015mg [Xenopus laevis]|uniref:Uncharacterized protein n=1 Tax=Xenopus laevis TaxID=8355 RepID=A0A974DXH9_XENLA|nr:hypothetical protein XELAEV_18011015mg [Xenopus laevis]